MNPAALVQLVTSYPAQLSTSRIASLRWKFRMLTDEMRYKLMRMLEANPNMSQRQLARELGVSLGRVNYCLQALISRGLVKARNFSNSSNKAAYRYLLTASGLEQKAQLTMSFLKAKTREYEALRLELEVLRREVKQ